MDLSTGLTRICSLNDLADFFRPKMRHGDLDLDELLHVAFGKLDRFGGGLAVFAVQLPRPGNGDVLLDPVVVHPDDEKAIAAGREIIQRLQNDHDVLRLAAVEVVNKHQQGAGLERIGQDLELAGKLKPKTGLVSELLEAGTLTVGC